MSKAPCEVCGKLTTSVVGVCSGSPACRNESYQRRQSHGPIDASPYSDAELIALGRYIEADIIADRKRRGVPVNGGVPIRRTTRTSVSLEESSNA